MKKIFTDIPFRVEHEAQVSLPSNPKRVYLLLHGFQQNGSFMFDQLRSVLPQDSAIIAPDGPLSTPIKRNEGYDLKYAWYFFDALNKKYLIDYMPAAEFLKSILLELNLLKKPITVIGYSQGGYLAPKIAEVIPSVDTVIGIACTFRNEKFAYRNSVMIHQINSNSDTIIDFEGAKEEFLTLRERGNLGRFIELEDVGHRLTNDYLLELSQLI